MIIAINGAEIKTDDALRNTIAMIKPGHDGRSRGRPAARSAGKTVVKAKLGELPDAQPQQLQQRQPRRR